MSKILIQTQVFENYAWDEHGNLGTGVNAYWKAKGGSDYVVRNIDINRAREIVESVRDQIEQNNDAYREYIVDWEVVADDHLTRFERDQLEYEGRITYGPHEIVV